MQGHQYDEHFFQSEVTRLENLLTRDLNPEVRADYEKQLKLSKEYLAKYQDAKTA